MIFKSTSFLNAADVAACRMLWALYPSTPLLARKARIHLLIESFEAFLNGLLVVIIKESIFPLISFVIARYLSNVVAIQSFTLSLNIGSVSRGCNAPGRVVFILSGIDIS